MSDNLKIFGLRYPSIDGIKVIDENGNELTYSRYPIEVPGDPDPSPVKFIDYDGTVLYSYSTDDFLALASLPTLVSHQGKAAATAWNWTLADAQAYVRAYGTLIIGQEYARTELDIELPVGALSPYLSLGINGTVTIDWGDGTSTNVTATSLTASKRTQHTYAASGNYTIGITTVSGSYQFYGVQYCPVLNNNQTSSSNANQNYGYAACVTGLRIAYGVAVGQYAFYFCAFLHSVTIPKGATIIGQCAFYNCFNLRYASIPQDATAINSYAFGYCYSLQSVTIPGSVTAISSYAFQYDISLKYVMLPYGVTSIGTNAFDHCYGLKSVTIPNTATSISGSMFSYCSALSSVTIPGSVTTISSTAFQYCYGLQSLIVPDSVTTIGTGAFQICYGLRSITFLSTTPPTAATGIFSSMWINLLTIYVPNGTLAAYQSATNWSTYASRMVELPA